MVVLDLVYILLPDTLPDLNPIWENGPQTPMGTWDPQPSVPEATASTNGDKQVLEERKIKPFSYLYCLENVCSISTSSVSLGCS